MRIVKVNIFRDNAVGPRLFKIDYGTKLELIGIDLPQTYEVHFSKSITEDAYRVLGDASGVVVPDVLLETDGTLYGWLYVHTGADDGWTKRSFMCVVQNRSGVEDVVICGDLNTWASSELDELRSAGYALANYGLYGAISTWHDGELAFDNICVKSGNIKMRGVQAVENDLGDHFALVATLTVV